MSSKVVHNKALSNSEKATLSVDITPSGLKFGKREDTNSTENHKPVESRISSANCNKIDFKPLSFKWDVRLNEIILYATNPNEEKFELNLNIKGKVPNSIIFINHEEIIGQKIPSVIVIDRQLIQGEIIRILKKDESITEGLRIPKFGRFRLVIGDRNAKHDNFLYSLPFSGKHRLVQGFGGKMAEGSEGPATHQEGVQNYHAVDFAMEMDTPIYAARDGWVVEAHSRDEDNAIDNKEPNGLSCGNFVRVRHNDWTYSNYLHLSQSGVSVSIGDKVYEGQTQIGLSGNSGYSYGPHLHFSVTKNVNGKLASIPWKFKDKNGKAIPNINNEVGKILDGGV